MPHYCPILLPNGEPAVVRGINPAPAVLKCDRAYKSLRLNRQHGTIYLVEAGFDCIADKKAGDSGSTDRTHYKKTDIKCLCLFGYNLTSWPLDYMAILPQSIVYFRSSSFFVIIQ